MCCKLWTKSTTVTLGGYISTTTQDSFVNSGMFGFFGDRKEARRIDVYIEAFPHPVRASSRWSARGHKEMLTSKLTSASPIYKSTFLQRQSIVIFLHKQTYFQSLLNFQAWESVSGGLAPKAL